MTYKMGLIQLLYSRCSRNWDPKVLQFYLKQIENAAE